MSSVSDVERDSGTRVESGRPLAGTDSMQRLALGALLALLAAFWLPTLARGLVIYPHDNTVELGASRRGLDRNWVNRRGRVETRCRTAGPARERPA